MIQLKTVITPGHDVVHIRYVKGLLSTYLIEYSNKNVSRMLHKMKKPHGVVGAELNCNFVGILFSTWLLLNICCAFIALLYIANH